MEIYIIDMITKSVHPSDHERYLRDTFTILRPHNMCLNLEKCVFGVTSGKFFGFMVQKKGEIKANPDNIRAALEMKSPITVKEM